MLYHCEETGTCRWGKNASLLSYWTLSWENSPILNLFLTFGVEKQCPWTVRDECQFLELLFQFPNLKHLKILSCFNIRMLFSCHFFSHLVSQNCWKNLAWGIAWLRIFYIFALTARHCISYCFASNSLYITWRYFLLHISYITFDEVPHTRTAVIEVSTTEDKPMRLFFLKFLARFELYRANEENPMLKIKDSVEKP